MRAYKILYLFSTFDQSINHLYWPTNKFHLGYYFKYNAG